MSGGTALASVPSSAMRSPCTGPVCAVEAKIEAVGAEIRELKADKADKAAIDSKVASACGVCARDAEMRASCVG